MSTMPEVFDAVVNCMSKNEMTPKVFCKGCAVLWKLTHQSEAVKVIFSYKSLESIICFKHMIIKRVGDRLTTALLTIVQGQF